MLVKWLCKGGVIIHSTDEETETQRREGHIVVRGASSAPPGPRLVSAHGVPGPLEPRLRVAPLWSSVAFSTLVH